MCRWLCFVFSWFVLAAASPAWATDFFPNVFDDPTPMPAPNGCDTAGRCSLREAVLSANANNGADTIILDEGTYDLTIPDNDTDFDGDLNIGEDDEDFEITIQGPGSTLTTIHADDGLLDRVMGVFGDQIIVHLIGFTIENGNVTGTGGLGIGGGLAINSSGDDSAYNLTDVGFLNNTAEQEGGGAWLRGRSAKIIIDGGLYSGNVVTGGPTVDGIGGGLRIGGEVDGVELAEVKNVVVTENHVLRGSGGGIAVREFLPVRLTNAQVTNNTASNPEDENLKGLGGGLFIANNSNPILAELINCRVEENEAEGNSNSDDAGGGLVAYGEGTLRIIDSTFADNNALEDRNGGGVLVFNGSDGGLEVRGSTFSGNTAADGAGLHHRAIGGTLHEITNSTFSGNIATGDGGGLYIRRDDDGFTINNVTFAGNSAEGEGGGINSIGEPILVRNSILSGNDSGAESDDCAGSVTSGEYNFFSSPDNADCPPVGDGLNPNDKTTDPLLGALANNGGPTLTRLLGTTSPAIGAGNPAGCVDGQGADLSVDQRGFPRPVDLACDAGAVETSFTDLEMVKTADGTTFAVGENIVYTLTVNNLGDDSGVATLTDTLPAQVTFVSADGNCTDDAGTLACDLGGVGVGGSVSVHVTVLAVAEGNALNTATVTNADDTNPDNDTDSVEVTISGSILPSPSPIPTDSPGPTPPFPYRFGGGGGCGLQGDSPRGGALTGLLFAAVLGGSLWRRFGKPRA